MKIKSFVSPKLDEHYLLPDDFFIHFFREHENKLHSWSPLQVYSADIELFKQDTPANIVYLIESGLVKLSWLESGDYKEILGLRRKNWLLGAAAVILERPYATTAATLTRCTFRSISAKEFILLMKTDAQFLWRVSQILSQEVHNHLKNVMILRNMPAKNRLEHFLCELICEEDQDELKRRGHLKILLRCNELAHIIAVTPEHLCRMLKKMEQQGVIKRRKGQVIVEDPVSFLHKAHI